MKLKEKGEGGLYAVVGRDISGLRLLVVITSLPDNKTSSSNHELYYYDISFVETK